MFGFGKKKEKPENKKPENDKKVKKFDRLIMGAIIGGAIGSVLGMGLAPKKGKETRKIIGQKALGLMENVKGKSQNLSKVGSEKKIPHEMDS